MTTANQRRLEEKERRRAEIVQAAEELAYDRGWDNVTVDGVAKRARLSRALVYLYFKDKIDLHAAIWERACNFLYARFQQAIARHSTGASRVEAMGYAYVAFAQEMPHYFEAISRFEAKTPEAEPGMEESAESRALARHLKVHQLMVDTIQQGFEDGSIRRDAGDPDVIAVSLWGFTHGIIQIVTLKGNELAQQGISQSKLVDQAFTMMRRSLQPPGAS